MPGHARGSLASKRGGRGVGVREGASESRLWAVLNATASQFEAVVGGGGLRGTGYARSVPRLRAGDLLVVRNSATGQLGVAKTRRVHGGLVTVTPLWLVDPAYRLNGGEYRTGKVVWVERPNLPPKARRIARRLAV